MKPPVEYSAELAERIAEELASGKSLPRICDGPDMPTLRAVCKWESRRPEFAQLMTEARRAHAERLVGELDEALKDEKDPQRARLLSEQKRWLASKWAPRVYGDKLEIGVEHTVSISAALTAGLDRAFSTLPSYSTRLLNHDAAFLAGQSEPDWMD